MLQKIYPSIICADFLHLDEELKNIEKLGIRNLHVDVMDGNFVPQITIGDGLVKVFKKHTNLFLDVHLMVKQVEDNIKTFAMSGADCITFHYEAINDIVRSLKLIKQFNIKSGIALQPETGIDVLKDILSNKDINIYLDKILIMSVQAGYSGQKFIDASVEKVRLLFEMLQFYDIKQNIEIQIDGGINLNTAYLVEKYIDGMVIGSAFFNNKTLEDKRSFLQTLEQSCNL